MSLPRPALVVPAVTALVIGLAPSATAAGGPQIESVDLTFVNAGLSDACGVEVTQHLWGTYSTVVTPNRSISNFHFRSTLTAGRAVVDSRAFGPTMEIQNADGSLTTITLGVTMRNLPGSGTAGPFAGRSVLTLVIDENGEVVEEIPGAESGYRQDAEELCAALTA